MLRKTCLFATYNQADDLSLDVQHYLRQLAVCKWDIHIAFSGKTTLSSTIRHFCHHYAITPHLRPNKGLDFGAWQDLINQGVTKNADYILLTNDSVFGPIYPLQPIFANMLTPAIDIWGMIESYEINWHFQSWFLCFNHTTFYHPEIKELFAQPFSEMSKSDIIQQGELKLGKIVQQIPNLKYRPSWTQTKWRPIRKNNPMNPMHLDWYSVLQSGKVPFIKKEVIRDNYLGIFWLNYYRHLLQDNSFFPLTYIDTYLQNYPNRPLPHMRWWERFKYLLATYDTKLAWQYFFKQGVACPILP